MKNLRFKLSHQTHSETLIKFILLLSVLIGYCVYLSWRFDPATGGWIAALTWSFFVLCTPVADAGFLLDFPIRLIFGLRMILVETMVWVLAIGLNIFALATYPDLYEKTFLTSLLQQILTHPWPYWSIIILCASGTFLSIYFGDEMLDVIAHRERVKEHRHGFKYRLIATGTMALLIIWAYSHLIETLGVHLPD